MNSDLNLVIMAGGSGTRLWPLSRESLPKQFLRLNSSKSMLQETIFRARDINPSKIITICNEDLRFVAEEQLRETCIESSILLEPIGRNTAPAIAISAFLSEPENLLLVLSSDHMMEKSGLEDAVQSAIKIARSGKLVTFGINPTSPKSEYGYIKKGDEFGKGFLVDSFIEKPPKEKAMKLLEEKSCLWNSGMFLFKASSYLAELKKYRPEIYQICHKASKNIKLNNNFLRINRLDFEKCPNVSIDYAVMEKTKEAIVVPLEANWNDIGSWSSLHDVSQKDANGNNLRGDIFTHDVSDSLIMSDDRLVTAIGLNNLIIVDTKDAVMIADKSNSQEIKVMTDILKKKSRIEIKKHRENYESWGKFDLIDRCTNYDIKKITINPGKKYDYKHNNKSDGHWLILDGKAKVAIDEKSIDLGINQLVNIENGSEYSIKSSDENKLTLIEVHYN